MASYTYILSDFPNNKYNSDTLTEEITDSSISSAVLDYMDGTAIDVAIYFDASLSAPDITTLDTVVANHQGIADPGPVVVENLVIDGSLLGDTGSFLGDLRVVGKLWVETIRRVKQEATDMIIRVNQVTPLGGRNTSGIQINNVAEVGDNFIFGVNKDGVLMAGFEDPSTSLSPVKTIYGTEYQLTSSLSQSTTTSNTPVTKVTQTTTDLPSGMYKITVGWIGGGSAANTDVIYDVTLNGTPQGTNDTMNLEPKDANSNFPFTRIFYLSLSGINDIAIRYWSEGTNSVRISDVTIELIRVE